MKKKNKILVPPAVLVIIDNPYNIQNFLRFLKCIYNPFKMVSKVPKMGVFKSENSVLIIETIFS